ncbi:TonB-dependent receptor [Desulfobacca acetoxidans]|uniref:TonB-dependent receptor n=1 Tax=Desulfobacca acetoxidans (strain ATCC 700848 / DSM 11109 / ASRB2) TaxID=880072 RepID=F2NIC8_DESAR|nr:TonB-dependent receptor [Desulfobacca acetoxidans]AEB10330.1 TonB-dependent receptor [Desulfobacca acetoxidans DSM 11109]HAY23138.1 TonB-dependent receptor [Desulfobacterales bacterium]
MVKLRYVCFLALLLGGFIIRAVPLIAADSDEAVNQSTVVTAEEEKKKAESASAAAAAKIEEPIFITATKTPRNPDDIPASITIVTDKDIERQNILTADKALQQVPGAFDRRGKGWADSNANVNLRGFPASNQVRTLILLDGQTTSNGYSTTTPWNSIPVDEIERIEVVKGPFSSLYGGNAMGGVVNILTKTPQKFEALADVSYGRYDTWSTYFSIGDRFADKISLKASYLYQDTSGYPTSMVNKAATTGTAADQVVGWIPSSSTTGNPTNIIGDQGDNHYYNSSVNTKLSWDILPGHKMDFSALLNWNQYDYGQFNSYLTSVATGQTVTTGTYQLAGTTNQRFSSLTPYSFLAYSGVGREHTAIYNLRTEHKLTESTQLKFRAGLLNQPHNWYTQPSSGSTYEGGAGTLNTTPSKSWSAEVLVEQAIGSKQALTGGLAYQSDWACTKVYTINNWRDPDSKLNMTSQAGGRDLILGAYLQDEIFWHPKFSTVIGARLDFWQAYGGMYQEAATQPITNLSTRSRVSFNPKIAFLYRPYDWMSWRTSVGTAFRPPNIYELYRTWQSGTYTYKSNPNLDPETTLSWEVGTTIKPFKGNVFTATFFDNHVDDMIIRVNDPTDPTGKTQIYQNAGEVRILGVEVETTQEVFSWLDVFGNMTLLDARVLKQNYNPIVEGKKLTYVPRQQFNFGFNAHYKMFNGNLTGRYVSKMYTKDDNSDTYNGVYGSYDPFFTLDGKITVTPVKYASISFSVDNILDREYFYSYLTPGRVCWIQAKLTY